jgi:Putative Ig domain/IPT/TIG domain
VTGSNFVSGVSGSVVHWNGANRTTTFVSATQLTAAIPAADIAAAGTASVTVQNNPPGGPVSNALIFTITQAGPPSLTITTNSLPEGKVNNTYSASLQVSGGTPPYEWSISSGSLLPGLSLSGSGVISGTPTKPGSSGFTVLVTDSGNPKGTATKAFTIKARKR